MVHALLLFKKKKKKKTILCWQNRISLPNVVNIKILKGKFPQTTMWIGWVESNFANPTVEVWADFGNPFKRSDYAKLCMSPSLDGTLPEYVIGTRGQLSIDFVHRFFTIFLNFLGYAIVLLIKFIHTCKCMHIHLSPNIPICKYKRRGKIHFHQK